MPARDADAGDTPPPTPSRAGGPPSLLSQIQQGTRLRAVAERPAGEAAAAMPEASNFDSADLTSMLRKAMGARRVAVKVSGQDEDDEDGWSDDEEVEWSD